MKNYLKQSKYNNICNNIYYNISNIFPIIKRTLFNRHIQHNK